MSHNNIIHLWFMSEVLVTSLT